MVGGQVFGEGPKGGCLAGRSAYLCVTRKVVRSLTLRKSAMSAAWSRCSRRNLEKGTNRAVPYGRCHGVRPGSSSSARKAGPPLTV